MSLSVVYARTADGALAKGLSFESRDDAVSEWYRLDDARRAGLFPHVKHFEVRDSEDPNYADAKRIPAAFARVITPRGFADEKWTPGRRTLERSGAEKAARVAWRKFVPVARGRNDQGLGGWFFGADGTPVAQGLRDLAGVAQRRNLIAKGQNGRWYVTEIANNDNATR